MNIGIFTDTYYPQINGVVTSIRTLEKELSKMGHKVYIFTTTDPGDEQVRYGVFRIPSVPFIFLPSRRMAISIPLRLFLKIKKLKLDVIHTNTEFSLGILGKMVSKYYDIPLVHTYHTMYEDYVHYIASGYIVTPNIAKKLSKLFCNMAKEVIAPTEKVEGVLKEYGVGRPIKIVPTGIDFTPFKKDTYTQEQINDLKEKYNLMNCPVVLSIGRIAKEKSMDIVVKAMPNLLKKLPDAKLLFVGDGPAKKDLEQLCKELGISNSVAFAGEQPWADIGKYYQLGNVFVSASITETQGLTFMEAMAASIPVIAKKDKSTKNLIKNKMTGFLFEKEEELSDILYEALTNTPLVDEIVVNSLNSIDYLSSENFAKKIEEIYMEVCGITKIFY